MAYVLRLLRAELHTDPSATNYQPKRPFLIGTSGHLQEVLIDPGTVPELRKWSRFWLDESAYNRVIASLSESKEEPHELISSFPSENP